MVDFYWIGFNWLLIGHGFMDCEHLVCFFTYAYPDRLTGRIRMIEQLPTLIPDSLGSYVDCTLDEDVEVGTNYGA